MLVLFYLQCFSRYNRRYQPYMRDLNHVCDPPTVYSWDAGHEGLAGKLHKMSHGFPPLEVGDAILLQHVPNYKKLTDERGRYWHNGPRFKPHVCRKLAAYFKV